MSLLGKSKVKCGPLRSPKSCQAQRKRNTKRKHKNNTETKPPNPQNPAKRALTKTAPMGQATYVPMNSKILQRNNRDTQNHIARSCEGVRKTIHPAACCVQEGGRVFCVGVPYTSTSCGKVTTATIVTIPENTTPTTCRSISGFALPSVIHSNQSPSTLPSMRCLPFSSVLFSLFDVD